MKNLRVPSRSHLFCLPGRFWGEDLSTTSFLFLVDFAKNILGYCLSLIPLTTSWAPYVILWIFLSILFSSQIYFQLSSLSFSLCSIPFPTPRTPSF
jgi:hypothetical protein